MPDTPALYLCIDQGGHASRALAFDQTGAVIARAECVIATQHPQPDWVEHGAEELVASVHAAIGGVVTALGARVRELRATGLATQRSTLVCWDRKTGTALSPVISWQDRRAHAWLAQFTAKQPGVHARTGLMLSAHYGASKLRWCLDHLPAVQRAAAAGPLACGPLASFLLFRLLDERPLLVDPSNAGRTLLWNLASRDWDPVLLELFGIARHWLPACVPTRYDYGTLCTGDRALPLTILNGDQSAALFAFGSPNPDTAYVNMGTGAFVLCAGAQRLDAPRLLASVAYADDGCASYVLEGTVNGAGAALAWAGETLGLADVESSLDEWLQRQGDPPLFLNGIAGLGAPFWIADFPSRFTAETEPWQKVVAVAESIVFLLQANLDEFARAGVVFRRIVATGGLAQSSALCQRLADLSGLSVHRPFEHEATARGLAFLLAGQPSGWPALSGADFTPRPNVLLRERYARWRAALDAAIRDLR
jgi:glycerol kinase